MRVGVDYDIAIIGKNLVFVMENIRKSIEEDRYLEFKDEFYRNYGYDYHQKCDNIK